MGDGGRREENDATRWKSNDKLGFMEDEVPSFPEFEFPIGDVEAHSCLLVPSIAVAVAGGLRAEVDS